MKRYCSFGIHGQLTNKGKMVDESDIYYIVRAEGYGIYNIAIPKIERGIRFFESEVERDEWIKKQRYDTEEL